MTPGDRVHDRLLGEADTSAQFSGHTQLQMMLDVEAALADAEATAGVIPATCVVPIQSAAKAERTTARSLVPKRSTPATSSSPWFAI